MMLCYISKIYIYIYIQDEPYKHLFSSLFFLGLDFWMMNKDHSILFYSVELLQAIIIVLLSDTDLGSVSHFLQTDVEMFPPKISHQLIRHISSFMQKVKCARSAVSSFGSLQCAFICM